MARNNKLDAKKQFDTLLDLWLVAQRFRSTIVGGEIWRTVQLYTQYGNYGKHAQFVETAYAALDCLETIIVTEPALNPVDYDKAVGKAVADACDQFAYNDRQTMVVALEYADKVKFRKMADDAKVLPGYRLNDHMRKLRTLAEDAKK